jgi:anti-sigma regulatory factor (Ser/Thr protein kinase)
VPAPLTVRLSGLYKLSRLEQLLEQVTPVILLDRRRKVRFDFGGLVGICPTGLALMTAVVRDADARGVLSESTELVFPRSDPVTNYLLRMDFLRVIIGEKYDELVREPFRRRSGVGFRPCREFSTENEAQETARSLTDAVVERVDTEHTARLAINIALGELVDNVLHHADVETGGFAAAQGWPRKDAFEIGIVDLGIGIRASLTKNPQYADITDDMTAISTALKPRVSSTPERNSGIGLFVTRLLLRENGGLLLVRSGEGAVYAGAEEGTQIRDVAFPGTLVALQARTDRPLDINRVYRMLGDGDGDDADDTDSAS